MRKNVFGRKLKRDTLERKALFKSLISELVLRDRIETTEAKAKAVKGLAEKLVTKARDGGLNGERGLRAYLSESAVKKMRQDTATRFVGRPGGYTRIIKLPNRFSDNASMVALEWVVKGDTKIQSEKDVKKENKELPTGVVEAEVITETEKKVSTKKSKVKEEKKAKK